MAELIEELPLYHLSFTSLKMNKTFTKLTATLLLATMRMFRKLFFLFVAFSLAGSVHAEVGAPQNVQTWDNGTGGVGGNYSASYTVPTGLENRVLVVMRSIAGAGALSNVTYDGVSLTEAKEQAGNGASPRLEIAYLVNPPEGAHTLAWSGTNAQGTATAFVLAGVDQSTPIGDTDGGNGSSNSALLSLDSRAGDLVIDILGTDNDSTATEGDSQTSFANNPSPGPEAWHSYKAGAASVTMNWSLNATEQRTHAAAVIRRRGGLFMSRRETTGAAVITTPGEPTASISVPEDSTPETVLGASGLPTPEYSISGTDVSFFTLTDNGNGTASFEFTVAPDFETPADSDANNVYLVTVRATNPNGFDECAFSVTVTDTATAPVITSHTDPDTESIEENSRTVTTIVCSGSETPTFSIIGGADEDHFEINAATGLLQFEVAPDFEIPTDADTNNTYVVTCQAENVAGSDSVTITVTVTDEDPEGSDATPILPQATVDTTLPTGWDGPANVTLTSADNLQTALNNVDQSGTGVYIIALTAGHTWNGTYGIRFKAGSKTLIIRTTGYASLPAYGSRVGPSDAANMARIQVTTGTAGVATSTALFTELAVHDVRLIGIEVTADHTVRTSTNNGLVLIGANTNGVPYATQLSEVPTRIILDRCYIHGTTEGNFKRAVQMDASYFGAIGCYISDIHDIGNGDTQCFWAFNSPGPYKLENNFLSSAGENVMIGAEHPAIDGVIPSDATITGNHCFKSLTWRASDPSYAGLAWGCKNNFELKVGRRFLIEGNVFENNWSPSQAGFSILFTVRGGTFSTPWNTMEDITFRKNLIKNSPQGMQLQATDGTEHINRVLIEDNLWILDNTLTPVTDSKFIQFTNAEPDTHPGFGVVVRNNTVYQTGNSVAALTVGDSLTNAKFCDGFVFENNIIHGGLYKFHSSVSNDITAVLNAYYPGWVLDDNVIVLNGYPNNKAWPAGNTVVANYAAVGFVDAGAGDFELEDSPASPFKNAGSDGEDIGVDWDALQTEISGVVE